MQKTISQSVSQSIPWQEYSLARISIAGNKLDGVIAALPKLMLETFLIRMQKPIQYKPSKLTGTAASRVRIRFFRRNLYSVFIKSLDLDPGFRRVRIQIRGFKRVGYGSYFSEGSVPSFLNGRSRTF